MTPQPPNEKNDKLLAILAIALSLAAGVLVYQLASRYSDMASTQTIEVAGTKSAAATATSEPGPAPPIDPAIIRRQAWDRISRHLAPADVASAVAIQESLRPIAQFFEERRTGVRPFAEEVLSFNGKWQYIRGKLPTADDKRHMKFLDQSFSKHVFESAELRALLEASVTEYLTRLKAIENRLLLDCRADIQQLDIQASEVLLAMQTDATFAAEYQRMLASVVKEVAQDAKFGVSREVVSLIAGEIAAVVAVRVGVAVATKLGVDAGILGAGAASSWATLGIGLAAAIVIDVALEWAMKAAGHDPVDDVAKKVDETLGQLQTLLVDGDPAALQDYQTIKHMAENDTSEMVRDKSRQAVQVIENSGSLGLQFELQRIHTQRCILRDAALRKMILADDEQAATAKPESTQHSLSP
ncbi:MAG: hypothetical protein SGJ20_20735 [Planctomycetota bacterium]|nr:hypothetical protein [Planctomycetota bacterium]